MSSENLNELFNEKLDYSYNLYKEFYRESIESPSAFWKNFAPIIDWFEEPKETFNQDKYLTKWFIGGITNACYNAVDRHYYSKRRYKVALIWENERGERRSISYEELFYEVNKMANTLRELGVRKGDTVTIYMPTSIEGIISMLACARIGAVHSVVFAGFASQALANRVLDAKSKIVITSDGYYRRGKLIKLKEIVDEALALLKENNPVRKVIIFRRANIEIKFNPERDYFYDEVSRFSYIKPERMKATEPLFILYTSGTAGKPKAVVHSTGGYIVGSSCLLNWVFNMTEENDVMFNTSDIGWIVGHSYIVYAPLIMGKTSVIYESAPDYPHPYKWAEILEKYGVNVFFTSVTALKTFMKYDDKALSKMEMNLKVIATAGEVGNPGPWKWAYEVIGKRKAYFVNHWWQTETGGPTISYYPGIAPLSIKPAPSCGFPAPGVKASILDDEGREVISGAKGYLILSPPYPPNMMIGMWNDRDEELLNKNYFSRFGVYYTGDYAVKDGDGYYWILGRADEVIKVSAHRIGAGEVESIITSFPGVAEAAVIGVPDEVKGETIHAFVVLRQNVKPSEELKRDIKEHVRKMMGNIAVPEVYFLEKLPKTRSGKVMRRVIKAAITNKPIGDITTIEDEAAIEEVRKAVEELKEEIK